MGEMKIRKSDGTVGAPTGVSTKVSVAPEQTKRGDVDKAVRSAKGLERITYGAPLASDKQKVLKHIGEQLDRIEKLLPQLRSINAQEDIKALEKVKTFLLDYKVRIEAATKEDSTPMRSYGESWLPQSNILGRIHAKFELPKALDELFRAVHTWKNRPPELTGPFFTDLKTLNQKVKDMDDKMKAENAPTSIKQFFLSNGGVFRMIYNRNGGLWGETAPLTKVQAAAGKLMGPTAYF